MQKTKMIKFINAELESDSESELESDIESELKDWVRIWHWIIVILLLIIMFWTKIIFTFVHIHFHLCFLSVRIYFHLYAFVWRLKHQGYWFHFGKNIVTWRIFDWIMNTKRFINTNIYRHSKNTVKSWVYFG